MRKDKKNVNSEEKKSKIEELNDENHEEHSHGENCQHDEKENVMPDEMLEQLTFLNNKFEEKIKEYEDKVLNLKKENLANLDNQKKQFEREKDDLKKYLFQKFFEDILVVLDSLEVGINAKQENYEKFLDGLKMTNSIFINTLNKYTVNPINAKIGEEFNDTYHECMGITEKGDNNKITDILSTGYKYGDRILRPTKVIVGTKS
jgi:molecular chaperone GrpE